MDAQGPNRFALLSEALAEWLARRRMDTLNSAYTELATLDDGARGFGIDGRWLNGAASTSGPATAILATEKPVLWW